MGEEEFKGKQRDIYWVDLDFSEGDSHNFVQLPSSTTPAAALRLAYTTLNRALGAVAKAGEKA